MNRIYKLVWNRQQGKFVVAQENAASRGKGSRAAAVTGKRAQYAATAALALAATLLAAPAIATTYTVTSSTDDGTGQPNTLSWAINQANTGTGDTIAIDSSVTNIAVTGTLPAMTAPVSIIAASPVQITGSTLTLPNFSSGTISLNNNVRVAGPGGNSGGPFGDDGGSGISGSAFTLTSSANITGGSAGSGTIGGTGGSGISGSAFTLTSSGNITGGSAGSGNIGGTGGSGIFGSALTLANSGTISGGSGGATVAIGNGGTGGSGISGSAVTLTNSGNITGGSGGSGGGGNSIGGAGGSGIFGIAFTLTNSGNISGGSGASGGGGMSVGGAGGSGISGGDFTLTNSGDISGGSGGSGNIAGLGGAGVISTGAATIYNSGTITGSSGANAVSLSGGKNKLVLLAGGQFTGNVVSTSGTTNGGDTFALGGTGTTGSFGLSEIGSQYQGFIKLIKEDTGTWTLTGSGSGDWTAQGGTLVLADSMNLNGTLAVQNGAAVTTNNATVSGAVNNAGTFAVTSGKTANTGAYTSSGGSTLRIGVAGMGSYGQLVVNGTANLGGTLFVDAASASGMSAGTLAQIISATSISGTFETASTNSLLFSYTPNYVGNHVDLTVAPVVRIFKTTTEQGNFPAAGAAQALDQIILADPTGSIGTLFQGFTTGQERQLSNAVSQTLPLLVGGSQIATNSAFSGINRVVQARIDGNRGMSSGDEFLGDRNVWFKPFGSWANQGNRNGISGFSANTYGVVAGVDRTLSERVRAGVAFAYAHSSVDGSLSVAPQSNKVDIYQLIGYGSYSLDQDTELNFQGDIGRNSNQGKRSIDFTSSVAEGSYDSTSAHVGVGLARSFALSQATTFTPGVRADYTWVRDAGYTESGAGALNLDVDSRSASQFVLSTDGKLNLQLNRNTNLAFVAGVGYDTINKQASITSAYAGAPGASFVTYGLKQSPWIGRMGAALTYTTSSGVDLSLRYDLEARSSFTNQTASARARWRF